MTGINVQPQIIIRRHNNRKRLFRLGNLTSLLRFLKFFTIYLRSVKHETKCGWKLQRRFFCRTIFTKRTLSNFSTPPYQAHFLLLGSYWLLPGSHSSHAHTQTSSKTVSNFLHSRNDRTVLLHLLSFVSWLVSEQLYSPLNGVAQFACLLSAWQLLKVFTGFAFTSHVLVE